MSRLPNDNGSELPDVGLGHLDEGPPDATPPAACSDADIPDGVADGGPDELPKSISHDESLSGNYLGGKLRAPFPWFGGKSRVSHLIWPRFGNVRNYVESFAGSLAVLLQRPHSPGIETVNDIDAMLSNFWRAVAADPDAVAHHADFPVSEADLHARHRWLVETAGEPEINLQPSEREALAELLGVECAAAVTRLVDRWDGAAFLERMKSDPEYYDAKRAGWWVWGQCLWIGSGWCSRPEWTGRFKVSAKAHSGVFRESLPRKMPVLQHGEVGRGVLRLSHQVPDLSGDAGAAGRGIHASRFEEKSGGLQAYMRALSERLRRVRVCCGDFERILGPAVTTCIGLTGVLLDPPYPVSGRAPCYNHDGPDWVDGLRFNVDGVWWRAYRWAIEHGGDPLLRIALCGYEHPEASFPPGWTCVAWKASGGYGRSETGKANARRERVWFSPHCLQAEQGSLW